MRSLLKWVVRQLEKLMAKKPVVFGSPDGSQFVDDDDFGPYRITGRAYVFSDGAIRNQEGDIAVVRVGVGVYEVRPPQLYMTAQIIADPAAQPILEVRNTAGLWNEVRTFNSAGVPADSTFIVMLYN